MSDALNHAQWEYDNQEELKKCYESLENHRDSYPVRKINCESCGRVFYTRVHSKKFCCYYPTDHCGVLRILTDKVHPRYMAKILETEGKKMNFSRSYRASIDRIRGISFTVPEIEIQNEAMEKVKELEKEIAKAMKKLDVISNKRESILKSYLQ